MNKKTKATDNSAPYRTLGMDKITAPVKVKGTPKANVVKTDSDLRVKGGKA